MTDLAMRDTIAALATAPGQAGIAIVRVSGDGAENALRALFVPYQKDCPFESHKLYLGRVIFEGNEIDECMAVLMRAPKSYTRQDVAEFQLHGGAWAAQETLRALSALHVRAAEPGEFTLRAYLNGRVDLSRAEAVMRIISASGARAAKAALRQLNGGASAFIRDAQQTLIKMLASLEAAIDYPEEIEESETKQSLARSSRALAAALQSACDERAAKVLEEGLDVVLLGAPNAGKSTLLNALLNEERAIVTDIPGTTRDLVRGSILLSGFRINLCDTAGIRQGGDQVEKIGVERALEAAARADVCVLLTDASKADAEALQSALGRTPDLLVYTKADLCACVPALPPKALLLSARTGLGMDELKRRLAGFARDAGEAPLSMRRHIGLALNAAEALSRAADTFEGDAPLEFGAVDLHEALDDMAAVTGDRVDEKLLDDIFSRFCVGK